MSIDRIGKGPSGIGPTGSSPVDAPTRTGATFSVDGPSAAEGTTTVSPASRARAGELSLDAYLDQRVSEATRHLEGKLPAADLAEVQQLLRSQLVHDPALAEMVRAATGMSPSQDE